MDERSAALLAAVRAGGDVGEAWRELFALDPTLASSAAFDLLAGEPRVKPSRALVVDPGDTARRRWEVRVAAAAALLAAPSVPQLFDEVRDELAEDRELAADVLGLATLHGALSEEQRQALHALELPVTGSDVSRAGGSATRRR